jgi:murein DD-endopeptidase MepM/ murein hydrolase activator NlpD
MPLKKERQSRNWQGVALVVVLVIGVGLLVTREAGPALSVSVPVPAEESPTPEQPSWQDVLQQQFAEDATPLPQVSLPTQQYVPPTLQPVAPDIERILEPTQLFGTITANSTAASAGATPTLTNPLAVASPTNPIAVAQAARSDTDWQPPPLQEPLSRDPRDHYWLARPVDSDAVNYPLYYYPYGSDGPENSYRVHHGVDMPNPIGEPVRAAGPGTVLWAADGFRVEQPDGSITETTISYGNTVLIQHDFGFRGQPIYTLYAHLSAILVTRGQRVATGDIVGLIGDTGIVSGSHVHFEVRVGQNSWYAVQNPVLWMVPYAGHGTIAGRVIGLDGEELFDQDISIIDRQTGRVVRTTTSYQAADTNLDGVLDINSDINWGENFAVGDIPEGRYQVVTRIDGTRVARMIDVYEGTTVFVELALPDEATPQSPG